MNQKISYYNCKLYPNRKLGLMADYCCANSMINYFKQMLRRF